MGYHYYLVSDAKKFKLLGFVVSVLIISTVTMKLLEFSWLHALLLIARLNLETVASIVCFAPMVLVGTMYLSTRRARKVYLVDFACFKPGPELMCGEDLLMQASRRVGSFTDESLAFIKKILERSGMGQKTYLPESMLKIPPNLCMDEARKEVKMFIFGSIDRLLKKTGVKPKEIGILIVNCSLFGPTPSSSSMIVNHYKLSPNVRTYDLVGMGCSAGLISIDLANNLLQVLPNSFALVVSMEPLSLIWYSGNNKSMLVPNGLFRLGGAAILLSNIPSDRQRSKYELMHTVRTHNGADDRSYKCVYLKEDEDNRLGLALSKDLKAVAGQVLKANITELGPFVLPMSEQLRFFATLLARKIFRIKIQAHVPDFKLALEHFCIHAGGKGVLDEMEKNLKLSEWHMEPSRMTLYRFGNTSSSSLWYQLAYCEAKGRIKKEDRAWQIGFGSGFKCNSVVWRALKAINPPAQEHNPWMDEIDEFPVPSHASTK